MVKLDAQNTVLVACELEFSFVTKYSFAQFANYNWLFFCLKIQFCKVQYFSLCKYRFLVSQKNLVFLVSQNIVGIPEEDWYSTLLNELYQEATESLIHENKLSSALIICDNFG